MLCMASCTTTQQSFNPKGRTDIAQKNKEKGIRYSNDTSLCFYWIKPGSAPARYSHFPEQFTSHQYKDTCFIGILVGAKVYTAFDFNREGEISFDEDQVTTNVTETAAWDRMLSKEFTTVFRALNAGITADSASRARLMPTIINELRQLNDGKLPYGNVEVYNVLLLFTYLKQLEDEEKKTDKKPVFNYKS